MTASPAQAGAITSKPGPATTSCSAAKAPTRCSARQATTASSRVPGATASMRASASTSSTAARGADWISAGAGNATIIGGGGGDVINATDGTFEVSGGPGDDEIRAGDGSDRIRGGPGRDTVEADRFDVLVGCEVVTRRRCRPAPSSSAAMVELEPSILCGVTAPCPECEGRPRRRGRGHPAAPDGAGSQTVSFQSGSATTTFEHIGATRDSDKRPGPNCASLDEGLRRLDISPKAGSGLSWTRLPAPMQPGDAPTPPANLLAASNGCVGAGHGRARRPARVIYGYFCRAHRHARGTKA